MMWIDVGIVFLLIIAIGFSYRLSIRLKSVRSLTTALAPSIERLSNVLLGANQAIGYLKHATDVSQKSLTNYIPNAQTISDDLLLLIEHADRVSYRLDDLIVQATDVEKNLRQTVLASARQIEKQKSTKENPVNQLNQKGDPRDMFVQRVIARYPKDAGPQQPTTHRNAG